MKQKKFTERIVLASAFLSAFAFILVSSLSFLSATEPKVTEEHPFLDKSGRITS
jgi:hypothetical protein